MQQRDYILREIEKFGKFLQILLAKFTGAEQNKVQQEFDAVRLELINELDFDIEEIPTADKEKISELLKSNPKLSYEHLDKISDMLFSMAESLGEENFSLKENLLKRSLLIQNYIAEKKPVYYFMKQNNLRKEN